MRELGVADRVRFAGHCEDVPIALRAIDIFVLASKFEPYGVALLEAKAAGVAIVATRVNEVPEILGESEPRRRRRSLVPPEDPAAMGDGLRARSPRTSAERRARRARRRDAVERHSLQAAIERLSGALRRGSRAGAREHIGAAGVLRTAHPATSEGQTIMSAICGIVGEARGSR